MFSDMEKVVKCNNDRCGQHFMHTVKATKCPFCHTEYVEIAEGDKKKKGSAKTPPPKDSFKMWS
jgi:Zn finger protein HypA/HybF involved in hydrogenase expression